MESTQLSSEACIGPRERRFRGRWLEFLLLSILCAFIIAGMDLDPFHGDEATYIRMSRDYDYLFHEKNPGRLLYDPNMREGRQEQEVRITTGSIHTFSIGFARELAGIRNVPVNKFWRWDSSPETGYQVYKQNVQEGRYPEAVLLHVSRIPSTLFGAGSLILLYLTVLKITQSRIAAVTTAILLASCPLFLIHVRRAMQEGIKMFALCLCLFLAARLVEKLCAGKERKLDYLFLGLGAGFTLVAKQDAAASLVAIYLGVAFILLQQQTFRGLLHHLAALTASGVLAFAVFFALMPVWWGWWANIIILLCVSTILFLATTIGDSARHRLWLAPASILLILTIAAPASWKTFPDPIRIMIQARQRVLALQVGYRIKNNIGSLDTLDAKATFLAKTVFSSGALDKRAASFNVIPMKKEMTDYQASFLSGRHDFWILDIAIGILFVAGLLAMLRRFNGPDVLVLSLFFITALIILATTPLPYDRYYLIQQIPYTFVCGIGADAILRFRNRTKIP